jgi:hypothetical protein
VVWCGVCVCVRVSCGLDNPEADAVLAWGDNKFGQLGLGDKERRLSPQRVPGLPPAQRVVAGTEFSAVLTSTWCSVRG